MRTGPLAFVTDGDAFRAAHRPATNAGREGAAAAWADVRSLRQAPFEFVEAACRKHAISPV